ncbi:protein-export chaperone SecB [uncultured Fibrobacter sp.]|uniref:protein-export chaperone SecB n=1 Tax=uncultured Fibrobacter sp. TaxID=261512 RepID=UPI0025E6D9C1|nr:protein-export chaperone SecB [uncultured Fibrobacter sp.]
MQGSPATFSLVNYKFDRIVVQSAFFSPQASQRIDFSPSCKFEKAAKTAFLRFGVKVASGNSNEPFCYVDCLGVFKIEGNDIPEFFFTNSIAILYPYVRAMVSLVCLQANFGSTVMLPTLNLSSLAGFLKEHTVEE